MITKDAKKRSDESKLYFDQRDEDGVLLWPSLTKQEFKDECDINCIMDKFLRTGRLDHVREAQEVYGDFSDGLDFHENQNRIVNAREAFEALPATIRNRFDNDPGKLIDFVNDRSNFDEAVNLGLIEKPKLDDGIKPSENVPPVSS